MTMLWQCPASACFTDNMMASKLIQTSLFIFTSWLCKCAHAFILIYFFSISTFVAYERTIELTKVTRQKPVKTKCVHIFLSPDLFVDCLPGWWEWHGASDDWSGCHHSWCDIMWPPRGRCLLSHPGRGDRGTQGVCVSLKRIIMQACIAE